MLSPQSLENFLKPQQYSDEVLVQGIIKNNDVKLFKILYDRYFPFVYGQCLSYFKKTEDAEDSSQDIFFKLYLKLDSFKFQSKFFTWMYRFVHNHCINYKRAFRYKMLENKMINPEDLCAQLPHYNYENYKSDNFKFNKLKSAISLLPIKEQQKVLFKYYGQGTVKELAERNNCSESAGKIRLKRLKKKISTLYQALEIKIL